MVYESNWVGFHPLYALNNQGALFSLLMELPSLKRTAIGFENRPFALRGNFKSRLLAIDVFKGRPLLASGRVNPKDRHLSFNESPLF